VHPLLLKEYGLLKKWVVIMDRRQDSYATLIPAGIQRTFGSGSSMFQRFRRRPGREETA